MCFRFLSRLAVIYSREIFVSFTVSIQHEIREKEKDEEKKTILRGWRHPGEGSSFSQGEPNAGQPDGVPDEPQCVGDGDLLAGVQQLLVLQVKILYSHVTNHKTTKGRRISECVSFQRLGYFTINC